MRSSMASQESRELINKHPVDFCDVLCPILQGWFYQKFCTNESKHSEVIVGDVLCACAWPAFQPTQSRLTLPSRTPKASRLLHIRNSSVASPIQANLFSLTAWQNAHILAQSKRHLRDSRARIPKDDLPLLASI